MLALAQLLAGEGFIRVLIALGVAEPAKLQGVAPGFHRQLPDGYFEGVEARGRARCAYRVGRSTIGTGQLVVELHVFALVWQA